MKKKISTLLIIVSLVFSCGKKDEEGPLQLYKCSCRYKTLDWEFGGYDTGTDTSQSVMATSQADAHKKCADLSYTFGEEYQDCTDMS